MSIKREFSWSVPKDPDCPEANEDKFAFSDDGKRVALCDGASESYDSKLWADMLVRRFVSDPKVKPEWVAAALADYCAAHDVQAMSWSKQAAYERGSFATLVGIEYFEEHEAIEVLAIGDSIVLLADGDKLIEGWPFEDPERFRDRPTLLATIEGHNDFIGASGFWTSHGRTLHLDGLEAPQLLCMTDALGEWALKDALSGGAGFAQLLSMRSEEQLSELVKKERAEKRMRVDDSTLLVLSFERKKRDGLPLT